jgi:hypothetical protein
MLRIRGSEGDWEQKRVGKLGGEPDGRRWMQNDEDSEMD